MSAYRKGYKAEREIRQIFEEKGYISMRSAGSLSPIDILVGNGSEVYAIQVKTGKRKVRIDEEKLKEYARMFRAVPTIAWKVPYHGWNIEYLTEKR